MYKNINFLSISKQKSLFRFHFLANKITALNNYTFYSLFGVFIYWIKWKSLFSAPTSQYHFTKLLGKVIFMNNSSQYPIGWKKLTTFHYLRVFLLKKLINIHDLFCKKCEKMSRLELDTLMFICESRHLRESVQ